MKLILSTILLVGALLSEAQAQAPARSDASVQQSLGDGASSSSASVTQTPSQFSADDGSQTARYLVTTAEDFVVDVYLNGKLVPLAQREMAQEIFGSIVEKTKIEVRPGDWVVFNVVNDRLRWGTCYFAVAGMADGGKPVFVSRLSDARWTCCDDPAKAQEFITQKDWDGDPVQHITKLWADGPKLMRENACKGWNGDAIWGKSHNTWIKFVYR